MEENSDCGGGCLQVMDRKSGGSHAYTDLGMN